MRQDPYGWGPRIRRPRDGLDAAIVLAAIMAALLLLVLTVTIARAHHVEPVRVDGDPACEDLGYARGFRVEPPADGDDIYNFDGYLVQLLMGPGPTVASFNEMDQDLFGGWLVKGGPAANLYDYRPAGDWFDAFTRAPELPNGTLPDIDHMEWCYDVVIPVELRGLEVER